MFPLTRVVRISLLYPRYFKTEAATQLGQSFSFGDFFHLLPFYSYYYSFLFVPMLVLPSLMLQMLSAFAVDVMGSLRGPHSALEAALGSSEIQFRFLDSAADSCGPFSPIPLHEFRILLHSDTCSIYCRAATLFALILLQVTTTISISFEDSFGYRYSA